ncbi:MAG: tail fiber domain-containing protein [Planctomycetes bacterium]|nr:tail fiber domain-containing protein [Planctomycetota bacterium]
MIITSELIVSGNVYLPDGSAAAPALAFADSVDTGLYRAAADRLGFSAGGGERMTLDSTEWKIGVDVKTDRWLGYGNNTALGVGAFGDGALTHSSGDEGMCNTAMGYEALKAVSSGNYNVAVGSRALTSNTTGYENVAVGCDALRSNTTGYRNVGVGFSALYSLTSGCKNVAYGSNAMYSNQIGSNNTAFGASALYSYNAADGYNSALGYRALYSLTDGQRNTACGSFALQNVTSACNNTAIGYYAMSELTLGEDNAVHGAFALQNNQTGSRNTAVGFCAGNGAIGQSFDNNSLLGSYAGYSLTTGSNNLLIGYKAGYDITSGNNNIIIGCSQSTPSPTTHDHMNIGGTLYGNLADGFLGVDTATPSATLHVAGNVYIAAELTMTGNILPTSNMAFDVGTSALAYGNTYSQHIIITSDRRLKTDIADLNYGHDEIMKLNPVSFKWKTGTNLKRQLGFLAQEVRQIMPEAVKVGRDEAQTMGISYESLIPVLVNAIKHQNQIQLDVQQRIDRLSKSQQQLKMEKALLMNELDELMQQ